MKNINAADATAPPGLLRRLRTRRVRVNPQPTKSLRVIKGRGWVA